MRRDEMRAVLDRAIDPRAKRLDIPSLKAVRAELEPKRPKVHGQYVHMFYCRKCNQGLSVYQKFCSKCGAEQDWTEEDVQV